MDNEQTRIPDEQQDEAVRNERDESVADTASAQSDEVTGSISDESDGILSGEADESGGAESYNSDEQQNETERDTVGDEQKSERKKTREPRPKKVREPRPKKQRESRQPILPGIPRQLRDGLWTQNPILVLLLGMCPALATTASATNALWMGLAVMLVAVLTNTVVSSVRKFIPGEIRIAAYIVIIAGVVSCLDLPIQAFLPSVSESLGIFLPLVTVNCVIYARAETFASRNGVVRSAIDGLAMGAGFLLALLVVACIRELLGSGTVFGYDVTFDIYQPMRLLVQPVGGFLVLGGVIAAAQAINTALARRKRGKEEDI